MKYHKGNPFAICFLIFFGTKKSAQITPLLSVAIFFFLIYQKEFFLRRKKAGIYVSRETYMPASLSACLFKSKNLFPTVLFFLLYILQWFHFKHIRILLYHFFHFVHFTFAFIAVSIH